MDRFILITIWNLLDSSFFEEPETDVSSFNVLVIIRIRPSGKCALDDMAISDLSSRFSSSQMKMSSDPIKGLYNLELATI